MQDTAILNARRYNPPPNFSCRYLTHSTEQIIWARKSEKFKHIFNYELMKRLNGGKQMKDVWSFPAIAPWEKACGKHPTQNKQSGAEGGFLSERSEAGKTACFFGTADFSG